MKTTKSSLMKALLTSSLSLLALGQISMEAEAAQGQRIGGNVQAAARKKHRIQVEFMLTARQHMIEEAGGQAGGVRVREGQGAPFQGIDYSPRVGLPDMNQREVRVLLPYQADVEVLKLEVLDEQVESIGFFDLAPSQMAVAEAIGENGEMMQIKDLPEGVQLDDLGRDLAAYGADVAIPEMALSLRGVGGYRAYRYAKVTYSPFRWNPATKELQKVVSIRAVLSCKPRLDMTPSVRERELGDPGMSSMYRLEAILMPNGVLDSYFFNRRETEGDYLIITTDLIHANSTQLDPFISMKESQGHKVFLKTVEEIESAYPASCRAESMRRFLRAEYQQLGVEYLLLIGDPDPDDQGDASDSVGEVPMMMTWPGGAYIADPTDEDSVQIHRCRVSGTDMYFTELTKASWDTDGDGFPAEYEDDEISTYYPVTVGGMDYGFYVKHFPVDFDEEISGARIPFSHVSDVDDHLEAQIQYQTDSIDFVEALVRRRVTLAMAEFAHDTRMDTLGRQIESDVSSHMNGPFGTYEIYEYPSYDTHMEEDALADEWQGTWGAGLVIWSGHGSETRTVVNDGTWSSVDYENFISGGDASALTTTFTRSIVISISCLNARPSNSNNLTHRLMEHAAAGMFSHTGVMFYLHNRSAAWGDESYGADMGYLLSKELVDGVAIGDAMRRVRGGRSASSRARAKGLLVITAYGDPSCGYIYQ